MNLAVLTHYRADKRTLEIRSVVNQLQLHFLLSFSDFALDKAEDKALDKAEALFSQKGINKYIFVHSLKFSYCPPD